MYRTIETKFWKDPKVRAASTEVKLFFLYLITNDYTHVSGIYNLPIVIASLETRMTERKIGMGYRYLIQEQLVDYDEEREIVWVKTMFSKQGRGEKHHISAARHLETLHDCQLLLDFVDYYPVVERHLQENTLTGIRDRVSIGHPTRARENQKQNQKQNQKVVSSRELFDQFCKINEEADEVFSMPRACTSDRKSKCDARRAEAEKHDGGFDLFLADFCEAVKLATKIPFFCGVNGRSWKASFDYFVAKHSNVYKILEKNSKSKGRDLDRIREMLNED